MARGRGYGGYGGPIIITTSGTDDSLLGTAALRAGRLASYTINDQADIRRHSQRQDRALIDNITNKMYKLDYDRVKPEREVALKTGFRRIMYANKRPPLEKETRNRIRMDRLRYPWDYTSSSSIFRSKPENQKKKSIKQKAKEQAEGNHYPEYDPLGLYRPREKRDRTPYPDASLQTKQLEKMLADLRIKASSKKVTHDPSDDTEVILRSLNRPLPKSEVANYVPYTGNLYDFKPKYDADFEMDSRVHKKIAESRSELEEFDRALQARFSRKAAPRVDPVLAITHGQPRADQVIAIAQEKTADDIRREENKKLLKRAREYGVDVSYADNLNDQIAAYLG